MEDVCIAGGGPAGLAAAIAFRQAGFSVTVFDCARPPIDKACGEGLMPAGVALLQQLGIRLPAAAGFAFTGIHFFHGKTSVAARFPNGIGLGLRRTVLHAAMAERAGQLGVRLCWDAKNVSLDRMPRARLIVAADGQNSLLRREGGLHQVRSEHRRYGYRKHYGLAPWSDQIEVYWGPGGQAYVTPVAASELSVATLSHDPYMRVDQSLTAFPALRERLAGASPIGPERGALSVSRRLRTVQRDGLALIGDASGSVDAITGDGLSLAFQQAIDLAEALRGGNLALYEDAHRKSCRVPHVMESLLLTLDAHPLLRRVALGGLAKFPPIFAALLSLHGGGAMPSVDLHPLPVPSPSQTRL